MSVNETSQAANAQKITIYEFEVYDVNSDNMQKSKRLATSESIKNIGGKITGNGVKVDRSFVALPNTDLDGFTIRNFNPNTRNEYSRNATSKVN